MRGAAQRLRLLEVPVRPVRAADAARAHGADRGLPLLQRLRPARAAQGRGWRRWPGTSSTSTAPTAACGCSRARAATPPASSAAISSSVDDVVKVNLDFLDHPERCGIFNLGTGRAATFNAVAARDDQRVPRRGRRGAALTLAELVAAGAIAYIPFPPALAGKYQSFTEADLARLRAAGYARADARGRRGRAALRRTADFRGGFLRVTCGTRRRVAHAARCRDRRASPNSRWRQS